MDGVRLGPYQIDRELGSGGMGKVYAATGPDGVVALKVVHPHLLETPGFFERFLREAQIGQSIRHENVVRTFDCGEEFADGRPQCFLVMEYVEGQTLADLQRELEKVPEELCRHVAREICRGLAAVHDAGVVHRDLKPENVLITADHVVKVMDLGVAQVADEALRLSKSGAFVGSVEYAAPEQFKGGDVDGRTDLHALGVLLYELSSGVHPFRGGGFHEVLTRVCDQEPRPLGEVNPQLSAFFEEVVHTLLVKDPRGRFASATHLLDVLRAGERSAWWHERARQLRATTKRPLRRIRIPRETAVYGRAKELARLTALFDAAKSGDGQVVLIEGEAGIGKSRLVDELIARLQSDGEDLNFLFGEYPPGGAATTAGAFSTAFREQLGADGCAAYLTQTPLLVPAFDALLSGDATPTGAQPLTKDSLQTCFVHALRGLGAERTTVLLIDDLHFAPEDARSLFTSLAMAVPGHRILLVGTTRPGIDDKWLTGLTRLPQTSQMALARLGPRDLIELLQDSLRSEALATSLSAQIARKSDGNPFFVFEIIRGLRDGQFLTQSDDGTWMSTRVIDDIQIPSSILDLVNARVADLTEEERDLLDVGACCGFEFDPGLIGEVLGVPRIPVLKKFGQIERQHRLVRASGRNYCFDHHQVQEALYGSLHEQMREEYHAALAAALETRSKAADQEPEALDGALCVDLCEHFLKGAQGERSLRYLTAAQAHLEKRYLHAQVAALTERALAVSGLLAGAERAKALLRLAVSLNVMGRRAREEECATEAERLAGEVGDEELSARAASALGHCAWRTARHAEATAAFGRALSFALKRGNRGAEAGTRGNLGNVLWAQGRFAEAKGHHAQALEIFREMGDRRGEANATMNLGIVRFAQGRVAEAKELYERRLALSRELGDRLGEASVTGSLSSVLRSQGRLVEAKELCERHLALSRETGYRMGEAVALVNLEPIWLALGDRGRARVALDASIALCREIGARYPEGYGLLGLGRLADEKGDSALARQWVERSLALRREIGHGDGTAESLIVSGELHLRAGEVAGARAALEEALSIVRAQGRPVPIAHALCLLARLPGGDLEAARAALAEARYHADSRPFHLHLWKATGDRRDLVEAKRLLDEALAKVPEEHHAAMLANVRANREILAAWRAEFSDGGDDDEPRGTESVTRIVPRA